jgi:hypothetical protein
VIERKRCDERLALKGGETFYNYIFNKYTLRLRAKGFELNK